MPTETITAKFVNDPREGYTNGSIRDSKDRWWSLPPNLIAQAKPYKGKQITVVYETVEKGDKTYRNIKQIVTTQAANGADSAAWQVPNFISNVVGQAIASGKVEGPADIKAWALAAKEAGEIVCGLKKDYEPALPDDEVPY